MKKILKLMLLMALTLPGKFLEGQTILFEGFEATSCNTGTACSGYITPSCFTGTGGSSHGSPNIDMLSLCNDGQGSMHLGMNSGETIGEGFYVDYPFRVGKVYEIEFLTAIRLGTVSLPAVSPYVLEVIATTGLTHNINLCSGNPPQVPSSENTTDPIPIAMLAASDGACPITKIIYCPTEDFEQLWIYTTNDESGGDDGLILQMEYLQVGTLCPPIEIYDDPVVDIPPGLTQRAYYIETSSNSPAYTENDPNEDTEFVAGEHIFLFPNTFISAQGKNEFLARIDVCGEEFCPSDNDLTALEQSYFQTQNTDAENNSGKGRAATNQTSVSKRQLGEIRIAPNPTTDFVNIQLPHILNSPTQILIYTLDGKLQYRKDDILPGSTEGIDVSAFAKGLHLLKIINGTTILTEKLMVE